MFAVDVVSALDLSVYDSITSRTTRDRNMSHQQHISTIIFFKFEIFVNIRNV